MGGWKVFFMKSWVDAAAFALETQGVIAMRLMKIACRIAVGEVIATSCLPHCKEDWEGSC
jgi:hypothetical protein